MPRPNPAAEPAASAGRRVQLLDAAIHVLATQGLRGLTHRAVQQEADLPHGSVTYYFKTRDQLVHGVMDRLTELETAEAALVADELLHAMAARPFTPDYARLAELTHTWWSTSRERQVARFELQLVGTREPGIQERMRQSAAQFRRLVELVAIAAGSTDPQRDSEVVMAYIDGMLFHFVVNDPQSPDYIETGLRRAIESLRADAESA